MSLAVSTTDLKQFLNIWFNTRLPTPWRYCAAEIFDAGTQVGVAISNGAEMPHRFALRAPLNSLGFVERDDLVKMLATFKDRIAAHG